MQPRKKKIKLTIDTESKQKPWNNKHKIKNYNKLISRQLPEH